MLTLRVVKFADTVNFSIVALILSHYFTVVLRYLAKTVKKFHRQNLKVFHQENLAAKKNNPVQKNHVHAHQTKRTVFRDKLFTVNNNYL